MINKSNPIEIQLIPLERIAEPIFDVSKLPIAIAPGVEVADVSSLMPPSDFEYMRAKVGDYQLRDFTTTVKYGLVHKYELQTIDEDEASKQKKGLLNNIFALLRVIRPHRRKGSVTGEIIKGRP